MPRTVLMAPPPPSAAGVPVSAEPEHVSPMPPAAQISSTLPDRPGPIRQISQQRHRLRTTAPICRERCSNRPPHGRIRKCHFRRLV